MPTWIQWVTFALGLIGSVSGLYALYLNHERTKIAKRKEKERLESKKKANLIIRREKVMGSTKLKDVLVISNNGSATAENITLRFITTNPRMKGTEVFPLYNEEIPTSLRTGEERQMNLLIHGGCPVPFEVTVTWSDDYKSDNTYVTLIS